MAKLFPILGTDVPPMIGRKSIMQRLWNDLTKKTPSHLSIVGPRFAGKTVLIHGLAERMRQDDSPYHAVLTWDLGHQTPGSNELFLKSMCEKLGEGLKSSGNEYGEHLLSVDEDEYNEMRDVLEALHDDGTNVLMLWDGFDKPLSTGKLTRNLWDQLRELASNPSLRLVTATRRPLHELIRSEELVTSDFWNIFDMNPVRVGIFNQDDQRAMLEKMSGYSFTSGGYSELENWTSAYPPLFLSLLNYIKENKAAGEIDNTMVNEAAESISESVNSMLQYLWNDCPKMARDAYRYLLERNDIAATDIGQSERQFLEEKGFVKSSGNRLTKRCRFLEKFVKNLEEDAGSMIRLFGGWDEYCGNIRELLELRLGQLTNLNATLRRFLQRSIEDIPEHPEVCLSSMRGIVDHALDLIWGAELGTDRRIPEDWFTEWQHNGERGAENHWNGRFPQKRGHQIRLLQLMTGTQNSAPKASRISKNTWVLTSSAHGFGDFGQHIDGVEIPVGVAVSAVNICLELAACLEKEIPDSMP